MKTKIIFVAVICLLMVACGIKNKTATPKKNYNNSIGLWSEHWEQDTIDIEGNVTYVDTLKISLVQNNLDIQCISDSLLKYSNIQFKNDSLTFTAENIVDPYEAFFIHYRLKYNAKKQWYEGTILNSRQKTNKVWLKKVK